MQTVNQTSLHRSVCALLLFASNPGLISHFASQLTVHHGDKAEMCAHLSEIPLELHISVVTWGPSRAVGLPSITSVALLRSHFTLTATFRTKISITKAKLILFSVFSTPPGPRGQLSLEEPLPLKQFQLKSEAV